MTPEDLKENLNFIKELNKLSKKEIISLCVKYRKMYLQTAKRLEKAEDTIENTNSYLDDMIANLSN